MPHDIAYLHMHKFPSMGRYSAGVEDAKLCFCECMAVNKKE